ncbi:hypothetical protein TSAR_003906 [Trichomalopsis sarcophagae]|uniref:peptidyl-tRNA hydrolase n=1 Tax=Trichomalopsis sarcophagae TaxID=543379 RepID=A0A232F2B8_9HYME|nr:hypothetical protein TSAR_003906 [Trichomalopsis sarcophagae]
MEDRLSTQVARGFLGLYNKLDKDRVKARALDSWEESGENLVVLKGINHKHLKFLAKDLRYSAVDLFPLYKSWGRSQIMLVLAVLGREEDLSEIFDGLTYLR